MLLNTLYFAFVSAFIVIVAIGHGLLFAAIWPNFLPAVRARFRRRETAPDARAEAANTASSTDISSNKLAA